MQGKSMVPLIDDPQRQWKPAAFSQFHRRPKVSADGERYMGYSINTDHYHYIEWYGWDHEAKARGELSAIELYDRDNDPHETKNLADDADLVEVRRELAVQLSNGWRAALPN